VSIPLTINTEHWMLCPHCKSEYMHIISVSTSYEGRDPLRVVFSAWCEMCIKTSDLEFLQHKGVTIVGWVG